MRLNKLDSNFVKKIAIALFSILSFWWIYVFFILKNESIDANLSWAASYQLMALYGAIFGFIVSRSWGGFKSVLGKTIIFFSLGLLFQVFGQTIFSFYNLVFKIEVPYPSLADVGFFFSIPFYAYAAILLGKASGSGISFKSIHKKIQAVAIPLVVLIMSYVIFLKGYEFDWSNSVQIFLDFGYPLGQAFYVSLALVVFLLSKDFLGGMMKSKVLIVLFALVVQYIADYNFLYQASKGSWINGGYGDYIYLVAYFIMSLALINLGSAFDKIKNS